MFKSVTAMRLLCVGMSYGWEVLASAPEFFHLAVPGCNLINYT
jgi:hypothetical protein